MPDVDQDSDLATLTRLRVLDLDKSVTSMRLRLRWCYYRQSQHDGLKHDFEGYSREAGSSYEESRLRSLGWISIENATSPEGPPAAVGFRKRRPNCSTTTAGYVVDTYTAMLLGEGREPAVRVVGDPDSTATLAALFDSGYAWDALQEVRTIAGAEGAAAILPEIIDGELSSRALRPEDLYVEWESTKDWIPRFVIEQRRVEVTTLVDSAVVRSAVWRTRAWDRRFTYIYEDVPLDHGTGVDGGPTQAADEGAIELAEEPIEHRAGRCPVIWLQNTRCSDEPIGDPDCANVYELIDRLDSLWSMNLRGTIANLDPTLVIADKMIERRFAERRAKGHGNKIEVSEVGRAELLEMTGKTIEIGWLTAGQIRQAIEMRTGVSVIQPDQAGAFASSDVALQILRGTANNRAAARRPSLTRTITQFSQVLLTLARDWGIKDVGADGPGIALAPRELPPDAGDEDEDGESIEPVYAMHVVGKGRAIAVSWGALYSPTPQDLQVTAQALTMATGGQPVLSRETGVSLMINAAQTDTDLPTELERIEAEAEARVASFESSMTTGADAELNEMIEPEAEGEGGAVVKKEDVQASALNGAQVTAFLELMASTGVHVAPGVSERFQARAFQIPPDEAMANVADQMAFLASKPKAEAEVEPAPVPNPRAAG